MWKGGAWPGNGPVRIAVAYDAANDPTGPYRYTLEVRAHYGTTTVADTARGQLVVVNRRDSPFGAGWWLAGLERLVLDPFGKPVLWVGGDGSTRRYTFRGDSMWGAPSLDRPDSLVKTAGGWARLLPGRVRVEFDTAGRHMATVNRLQHRTEFLYDTAGRVDTVTVPLGTRGFAFVYGADGRLERAESPGLGTAPRVTKIHQSGLRVDSITDPDTTRIRFAYADTARALVPTARRNRLGVPTLFRFDGAGRVAGARIDPNDTDSIVTRLRAIESLGLAVDGAGALDTARAYALMDGPRTDVRDSTRLWLDRWGAPRRIRNALRHETVLTRDDPRFPALVTGVRQPNGMQESAVYDARGNVVRRTQHNALDDGDSAVTRFAYDDPRWPDLTTRTELPEGEVMELGYDQWGNRIWQQAGTSRALREAAAYAAHEDSTRASFHYDAEHRYTHSCTPVQRKAGCTGGDRAGQEWTVYDTRGNLAATRTPLGFWSVYERDVLGRDSVVHTPIDSARSLTRADVRTFGQRTTTAYKPGTDLVRETESFGPAQEYRRTALGVSGDVAESTDSLTLVVVHQHDAEGKPVRVDRRSVPDIAGVGTVTTQWRYDAAGRQVAEESTVDTLGRVGVDSTVYDPAGNVREAHTRRGTLLMQYDELGRLLRRQADAAVDSFRYDLMGRMVLADNEHARIRRSYYPGGALRTDSQTIVMPAEGVVKSYGLAYGYDRQGRRRWLEHPTNLSPNGGDTTRYAYDPATGRLTGVEGTLGGGSYRYDADGRVRDRDGELSTYDADGRLASHSVPNNSTVQLGYDARNKVVRAAGAREEELDYDGLGHLVFSRRGIPSQEGQIPQEEYRTDALANVAWKRITQRVNDYTRPDPDPTLELTHEYAYIHGTGRLANIQVRAPAHTPQGNSWGPDSILAYRDASYQYNLAGDREFEDERTGARHDSRAPVPSSTSSAACGLTRGYVDGRRWSLYNARGKVKEQGKTWGQYVSVETPAEEGGQHACPSGWELGTPRTYAMRRVLDRYGYDALGRRVWVKTEMDRSHCAGTAWPGGPPMGIDVDHCDHTVRRTVWDGDQLLWETRYPTAQQDTGLDARNVQAQIDREQNLPHKGGLNTSRWAQHGRVAYTYGAGGVDQPIAVARLDYSYDLPGLTVLKPHTNWKGIWVTAPGQGGYPA